MNPAPKYLDTVTVQDKRQSTAPVNRSRSGYGGKIGTSWELKIGNRWHRVYVMIWSNAGTAYVLCNGSRWLLSMEPGGALAAPLT